MASRSEYDPDSGQVYKETTVKVDKSQGKPWDLRCRAKDGHLLKPSQSGTRSLQQLCMQKLVAHANSLQPETVRGLPDDIAIRIWTAIRREWRESFHVWRTFVDTGFWKEGFKHSAVIDDWQSRPVIGIFDKLSSPRCAWLVNLTLGQAHLSVAELKEVSRVANLQHLHVQHNDIHFFSNEIVKAWSTRARLEGAFAHLKSMSLVNTPEVTASIFDALSSFAALQTLFYAGKYTYRHFKRKAKANGWSSVALQDPSHLHRIEYNTEPIQQMIRAKRTSIPANMIAFAEGQRPTETETNVQTVDVQLGKLAHKHIVGADNILLFRRDEIAIQPAASTVVSNSSRPHKRPRLKDWKEAGFHAMLEGTWV